MTKWKSQLCTQPGWYAKAFLLRSVQGNQRVEPVASASGLSDRVVTSTPQAAMGPPRCKPAATAQRDPEASVDGLSGRAVPSSLQASGAPEAAARRADRRK